MKIICHRHWRRRAAPWTIALCSPYARTLEGSGMAGPALPDDRELAHLMALAQAGDRAAYDRVLRGCMAIIDRHLAEDKPRSKLDASRVETCLRTIHAARHTFDPKRSFIRWVAAIARRHGLSPRS